MHHEKGDIMLKMSLNKIRGSIQMYPENWINLTTTNCYAYALGLDINENNICISAYQPGTIAGINNSINKKYLDYSVLIENIKKDLEALNIYYREIESKEQIKSNEWKIALFVERDYSDSEKDLLLDFHFLRTNKRGIWTHKQGYYDFPSKKDYVGSIITDLEKCDLCSYKYKKCYALSLNKR